MEQTCRVLDMSLSRPWFQDADKILDADMFQEAGDRTRYKIKK